MRKNSITRNHISEASEVDQPYNTRRGRSLPIGELPKVKYMARRAPIDAFSGLGESSCAHIALPCLRSMEHGAVSYETFVHQFEQKYLEPLSYYKVITKLTVTHAVRFIRYVHLCSVHFIGPSVSWMTVLMKPWTELSEVEGTF